MPTFGREVEVKFTKRAGAEGVVGEELYFPHSDHRGRLFKYPYSLGIPRRAETPHLHYLNATRLMTSRFILARQQLGCLERERRRSAKPQTKQAQPPPCRLVVVLATQQSQDM